MPDFVSQLKKVYFYDRSNFVLSHMLKKKISLFTIPTLAACFALMFATSVHAQKREVISGNLKELKGQTSYNIMFTYDDMLIGDGKKEKEYLLEKKRSWDEKEPGRGSAFVTQWFNDRERYYEPTFIKGFEKYSRIKLNDRDAQYTLIFKTTRTEGGWNIGITSHFGEIDGELLVVETADKNNVVAIISFRDISGKNAFGGDFEMTTRIQSAYEKAGMWLGDYIRKKTK